MLNLIQVIMLSIIGAFIMSILSVVHTLQQSSVEEEVVQKVWKTLLLLAFFVLFLLTIILAKYGN